MSTDHEALLLELRLLADAVLDRVEGVLQQFAADAGDPHAPEAADDEHVTRAPAAAGGCSWCPLCAGAALLRGENHELVSALATKLAALLALLRVWLDRLLPAPHDPPGGPAPTAPPERGGGFVPISVTIRT